MKLHLPNMLRKALLVCMAALAGISTAMGTSITLPDSSDFAWIAGSNASGIGVGATSADIVQNLAAAITASNIGNTDLTGWFGGTGQGYAANSGYRADISITSADSFTFKSRSGLSGEYVALGVELTEAADSITLTFANDKKAGYSVWSYDTTTSTATELIANTGLTAEGTVNTTYNTATVDPSQIFVVWTANPSTGNAGAGAVVTISDISLSYVPAGTPSVPAGTQLTMPATANNGGHGSVSNPFSSFAGYEDGGYMFNNGGVINPAESTGEGILKTADGITSVTLKPRGGAGGSGEAIVLSASEMANYEVTEVSFYIGSSCSGTPAAPTTAISGTLALSIGVVQKSGTSWALLGDKGTGTLTIGEGGVVTLTLPNSILWSDAYKLIAVADNLGKQLSSESNTADYTLRDIRVIANGTLVTDFYWKGSGNSSWTSSNWASSATGTGKFQIPGNTDSTTVNAIFNNSSDTATIAVNGEVSVDSLSVQAGNYTFAGTNATTDSISATEIEVSVGATMGLSDIGINSTITNSGTVNLSGTINLVDFQAAGGSAGIPAVNGYSNTTTTYRVVDGGTIDATNVTSWLIDGTADAIVSTTFDGGVLSVTVQDTTYYVSSSELVYDGTTGAAADAAGIALNGNTLKLGVDITGDDDFITATAAGGTLDLNGWTLDQSSLGELAGETILKGDTSSTYDLGSDTALATKLSLGPDWTGKVKMGDVTTPTAALDLSALGKDGSSIELGSVDVKKLTSTSTAALSAKSLKVAETSAVGGNLKLTDGPLTLGGESAAEMTVNGDVSVDRIVLGNAGSSLTAGKLVTGGNSITIGVASQDVLDALNVQALNQDITIITLDEAYNGGATLDTTVPASRAVANAAGKYETELVWSSDHKQLQYKASVVSDYVSKAINATSSNGQLGAGMLQSALEEENPQVNAPESGLARALDAVDNGTLTDEGAAAIAGASTAVLGMAAHGDLDRQLQAIRNRTTTMGVDQSVVHHDMPYFNAWINAEGDYSELSDDGTEGGYKLNSWGGTVGFDVDITPTFTAGMALTAMYGDLTITGADDADGDLNTYYVSAFARYCASAWTHTFVASVGMSEFKLSRNIMGEEQESDTNGLSFGLMYEVGRVFALNEDGTACLQPIFNVTWRHTTVDGYEEEGSNLALEVDDQTLDTITLGLGARLQAVVGESMYNRTSIFEARILGKFDAGDTNGTSEVSLAGVTGEVESAERGAFGLEIGAGLTIPMGDEGGSLFMDASLELRADYTNVNGTVGYRVNF